MEDMFVYDYEDIKESLGEDAEEGAMTAKMITDMNAADYIGPGLDKDGWEIDFWVWDLYSEGWVTDEEDCEDPDNDEINEQSGWWLLEDAKGWGTVPEWMTYLFVDETLANLGVPTPVEDYLGDLDFDDNEWDHEDRSLSYEYDKDDWVGLLSEDLREVWTCTSKGEFESYQMYGDNDLMYELKLKRGLLGSISGYESPLLLGVTGVLAIGIIYVITRRNK